MAKKAIIENNITEALDDIMSDRFGSYSKYIIQERALPDARDGLKPVQRRILFSMYKDGNTYEKAHRKSAKAVGQIMGVYHPHGDSSIYEAMVRLSQDWKVNVPLIDMHGNNGSIDDDPPAAMRYTEARLAKSSSLLLDDIDYDTVAMTNNYDDTVLEPTVLPARYPLLLVNGSTGIASGYATNIAPHNLNEIINATIYRLNHPECELDELLEFVKGPDFPTGGIVQGKNQIKEVFRTGRGKVVLRSKCEIVEGKTIDQIVVTEIPYEVVKANLVKKINDISLAKDVDGILDVRDESGRNGLRIVIDIKKDVDSQMILNYLYKNTDLQINYAYNNIAIVDHRPTLMTLTMALDAFIAHRREVVLNRSIYLKNKKEARIHIIEGLIKAISILDAIIELIRKSKDKKDAKDKLMNAFLFTDEQAEAIVNLRLYRLSNTDIKELKEEFARLSKELAELSAIINSKEVLDNLLSKELKEVNELYPSPRKTKIEDEVSEIIINKEAMIANETCYIALSKDGYIKRFSQRAFDANPDTLPFTKEGDHLVGVRQCETLDTLLAFTNLGNYIYLPVYKIEEARFKDLGKHLSNYVKMEGAEKIIAAIIVKNFDTYAFVLTLSKSGMLKKTSMPKFTVQRTSKTLTAMKLKNGDEMVSVALAYEGDDIITVSLNGYYNKISEQVLQDLATRAQGVGGIKVKDDEAMGILVDHHDGNSMLLCSSLCQFKRIHYQSLEYTARNTRGNRLFKIVKSKPQTIVQIRDVSSYGSFYVKNEENISSLSISDIPFMDLEATFSNPLKLTGPYHLNGTDQKDILRADYIPLPADYQKSENDFDQTNLF